MTTPRTLYAKSGDVHLAYQAIGAGERDIVLVLDWASHLEAVWEQPFIREFIASLNRYARVLWFDMRGVGLSDRVVDPAVATEEWMDGGRDVSGAHRVARPDQRLRPFLACGRLPGRGAGVGRTGLAEGHRGDVGDG